MSNVAERRGQRWHFEKTLSFGNILTTIVIGGALINYTTSMDKRIQLNTTHYNALSAAFDKHELIENRQYRDLREDMKRLHAKMDDLILRVSR